MTNKVVIRRISPLVIIFTIIILMKSNIFLKYLSNYYDYYLC